MAKQSGNNYSVGPNKRRQLAREALRVKINGERCIAELEHVSDELRNNPDADVPRLKALADVSFGKLKKILPDLRSVEHTGDEGEAIAVVHKVELVALNGD